MTRITPDNYRAFAVAICNGCGLILAQVPYPPRYAWIMQWQSRDCTIQMADSLAMPDLKLSECTCKKAEKLI